MASTTHLQGIQPDGRRTGKCGHRRRKRKRTIQTLVEKGREKYEDRREDRQERKEDKEQRTKCKTSRRTSRKEREDRLKFHCHTGPSVRAAMQSRPRWPASLFVAYYRCSIEKNEKLCGPGPAQPSTRGSHAQAENPRKKRRKQEKTLIENYTKRTV